MFEVDVVVVGSGIAGLTVAARLAQRGLAVTVVEQHAVVGGYCSSWTRTSRQGGRPVRFTFDAGVHDVSGAHPGQPVARLLQELGVQDRVEWLPIDHEVVQPGLRMRIPARPDGLAAALVAVFPGERAGIHAMIDRIALIHGENVGPGTDGRTETRRWLDASWSSFVQAFVRDHQLRTVMHALCSYLTHDGSRASAVPMAVIVGGYWLWGGRAPRGGSQRIPDALVAALAAHGGVVRRNTAVRRIRLEGSRAVGVELASGERIDARAVISNACVRRTLTDLLDANPVEAPAASTSAYSVFLGLDVVPSAAVITLLAGEFRLSIANPSAVDDTLAPPGHASVTITALIPPEEASTWNRSAPDYLARRREFGDDLVRNAVVAMPELADHVRYRQDATPATFARYTGAAGGGIYGTWPPVTPTTAVENLFFCGAGVFPGPGVEAAVRCGHEVARLVEIAA